MKALAALAASLLPFAASAEATQVTASGFLITHEARIAASPERVFQSLGRIGEWWSGRHTYSGDASRLSLELRAGGCFCETWPGNSIEHARVLHAARDKSLRLEGSLGPLQDMAVHGILNFTISAGEDGSAVTMTYRVRGADAGLEKLAPVVDKVLGEQLGRLAAFAARP